MLDSNIVYYKLYTENNRNNLVATLRFLPKKIITFPCNEQALKVFIANNFYVNRSPEIRHKLDKVTTAWFSEKDSQLTYPIYRYENQSFVEFLTFLIAGEVDIQCSLRHHEQQWHHMVMSAIEKP